MLKIGKVETELGGYLVGVPAGPAIKKGKRIVGYVVWSWWIRVKTRDEARRILREFNGRNLSAAVIVEELRQRTASLTILGTWNTGTEIEAATP